MHLENLLTEYMHICPTHDDVVGAAVTDPLGSKRPCDVHVRERSDVLRHSLTLGHVNMFSSSGGMKIRKVTIANTYLF